MNYSKVFSESWRVFRSFRVLWMLGLLTGCSGVPLFPNFKAIGEGGFGLSLFPDTSFFSNPTAFASSPDDFFSFFLQMMVYFLVLSVVLFIAQTTGRTATIKALHHEHETTEKLGLGKILQISLPALPKVFIFSILVGTTFMGIFLGVWFFGYVLSIFTFGLGFLLLFPIITIMTIFVSVYYEIALRVLLLENKGVIDTIGRAWDLIRHQLLPSGIFSMVFYFLQAFVMQILFVPLYIIMVPFFFRIAPFPGADPAAFATFSSLARFSSIAFLLYYPVIWIVSGLIQTFTQTGWNKVYREYTTME
ncbi:MAG: hypothetical protein DWQ07_24830 [Chloroflexi bacterium]|nr:MAG: hypothetical protein DWQ07_24830 [Chloroflexota bacterium]MBL1197082.1 hypothetical protein [Chloroflexota bacterium]